MLRPNVGEQEVEYVCVFIPKPQKMRRLQEGMKGVAEEYVNGRMEGR